MKKFFAFFLTLFFASLIVLVKPNQIYADVTGCFVWPWFSNGCQNNTARQCSDLTSKGNCEGTPPSLACNPSSGACDRNYCTWTSTENTGNYCTGQICWSYGDSCARKSASDCNNGCETRTLPQNVVVDNCGVSSCRVRYIMWTNGCDNWSSCNDSSYSVRALVADKASGSITGLQDIGIAYHTGGWLMNTDPGYTLNLACGKKYQVHYLNQDCWGFTWSPGGGINFLQTCSNWSSSWINGPDCAAAPTCTAFSATANGLTVTSSVTGSAGTTGIYSSPTSTQAWSAQNTCAGTSCSSTFNPGSAGSYYVVANVFNGLVAATGSPWCGSFGVENSTCTDGSENGITYYQKAACRTTVTTAVYSPFFTTTGGNVTSNGGAISNTYLPATEYISKKSP